MIEQPLFARLAPDGALFLDDGIEGSGEIPRRLPDLVALRDFVTRFKGWDFDLTYLRLPTQSIEAARTPSPRPPSAEIWPLIQRHLDDDRAVLFFLPATSRDAYLAHLRSLPEFAPASEQPPPRP